MQQEDKDPTQQPPDNGKAPPKKAPVNRYAGLRNHSIRFEDAIDPNAERVKTPNEYDVLFGRGKGNQNHPGNKRMRGIIHKYKVQYHSLKRREKRRMIKKVFKEIRQGGATRFLKWLDDESNYVIVDAAVAIQKVSHTLRCRKSVEKQFAAESKAAGELGGGPSALNESQGTNQSRAALDSVAAANGALHMNLLRSQAATLNPSMGTEALRPQRTLGIPGQELGSLSGGFSSFGMNVPFVPGGAAAFATGVDYYNNMRRQQLIRETMLFQQMGDTLLLDSTGTPSWAPSNNIPLAANNALGNGFGAGGSQVFPDAARSIGGFTAGAFSGGGNMTGASLGVVDITGAGLSDVDRAEAPLGGGDTYADALSGGVGSSQIFPDTERSLGNNLDGGRDFV